MRLLALSAPCVVAALLCGACAVDFDENLLTDGSADITRTDAAQDLPSDVSDLDQLLDRPDLPPPPDSTFLDQALAPDLLAPDLLPLDTGPVPDVGNCPIGCTSCTGGICQLACSNGCVCPTGWDVAITCGNQGCLGAIDCSKATNVTISCGPAASCTGNLTCGTGTCTVTCDDNSCLGDITCGAGFCTVTCLKNSCKGDVDCSSSCGCSVECAPGGSCSGIQICPPACGNQCSTGHNCDNC